MKRQNFATFVEKKCKEEDVDDEKSCKVSDHCHYKGE